MTTANPLAKDFDLHDTDRVVDGPWPPRAETPAAVVAEPDALAPAKKRRGRTPGSKNKTKKAKSSKPAAAKAKTEAPAVPETQAPVQSLRIAAGGEGMLSRVRRISGDTWLIVAACLAAIALGTSIAFMVIR